MSVIKRNNLIIFKAISESENDKDIYYETFISAGFQVIIIPVLQFEFVNLDQLLDKIKNPDLYTGIIFSSPRCVTGLELSLNEKDEKGILEKWKNHKHFVVGTKTGEMVESLGFNVLGKEAGNGDKLAEIICNDQYSKPFLYPIGSLTQDNFKSKLKTCNIDIDEIIIYNTKPHSELEENISKIKNDLCDNSILIYFSPSGVKFSLPVFQKLHLNINHFKCVAIGPTTEKACIQNGLNVAKTSAKPDPKALLEAVLSIT